MNMKNIAHIVVRGLLNTENPTAPTAVQRWTEGMRMAKCTNCIHHFVCKTLKGKLEDSYAETCVAYLNREDCVAVVRCKDCRHYIKEETMVTHCRLFGAMCDDDDFCSYGERKDNERKAD